jgi:chromosome partitioning protein
MRAHAAGPKSAHVIVLGNEKGGSGKSTTAMHLVVALLKSGFRVASVDTDSRQRSLTRYIENRANWARHSGLDLELPAHHVVKLGAGEVVREIEAQEFTAYVDIILKIEREFDVIVVDTPANDSYLMRLSHSMADTLITPINDSFVDLDVLGRVDPDSLAVIDVSHYAELVRAAIGQRNRVDGKVTDWVVVRNRIGSLFSRNQRNVIMGLRELAATLDFRVADGISERVIFREFFPVGLTAFDTFDKRTFGFEPTMSHLAARNEIRELIASLGLLKVPGEGREVSAMPPPATLAASAEAPMAVLN